MCVYIYIYIYIYYNYICSALVQPVPWNRVGRRL